MKLNTAQTLLVAFGADRDVLAMGGHKRGRFPSNTKKGPGRIHLDGKKDKDDESSESPQ